MRRAQPVRSRESSLRCADLVSLKQATRALDLYKSSIHSRTTGTTKVVHWYRERARASHAADREGVHYHGGQRVAATSRGRGACRASLRAALRNRLLGANVNTRFLKHVQRHLLVGLHPGSCSRALVVWCPCCTTAVLGQWPSYVRLRAAARASCSAR